MAPLPRDREQVGCVHVSSLLVILDIDQITSQSRSCSSGQEMGSEAHLPDRAWDRGAPALPGDLIYEHRGALHDVPSQARVIPQLHPRRASRPDEASRSGPLRHEGVVAMDGTRRWAACVWGGWEDDPGTERSARTCGDIGCGRVMITIATARRAPSRGVTGVPYAPRHERARCRDRGGRSRTAIRLARSGGREVAGGARRTIGAGRHRDRSAHPH